MNTTALTSENFKTEVLDCTMPVLVDFYAHTCRPCNLIAPILDEIASEYPNIKVVKLNVYEASDIAALYSVRTIPTIILFKNGEVSNRVSKYMGKDELIRTFQL